jgi:hypothetical protein
VTFIEECVTLPPFTRRRAWALGCRGLRFGRFRSRWAGRWPVVTPGGRSSSGAARLAPGWSWRPCPDEPGCDVKDAVAECGDLAACEVGSSWKQVSFGAAGQVHDSEHGLEPGVVLVPSPAGELRRPVALACLIRSSTRVCWRGAVPVRRTIRGSPGEQCWSRMR